MKYTFFLLLIATIKISRSEVIEFEITEIEPSPKFRALSSKIEEFEYMFKKQKMPGIKMFLGTPPREFDFMLNTFSSKIYIIGGKEGYDESESSTSKATDLILDLNFISSDTKGQVIYDTVTVINNNIIMRDFPIVKILGEDGDIDYVYQGMLGFDFLEPNSVRDINAPMHFSFFSNLFVNGYIKDQVFYIGNFNGKKKIVFGDDLKREQTKRNYRECDLIRVKDDGKYNPMWTCNLNAVYFEDGELIRVDKPVAFGIHSSYICVDEKVWSFIKTKYFKEAFGKKSCKAFQEDTSEGINCDLNFQLGTKTINFVFGKWTLKLHEKQLWDFDFSFSRKFFKVAYHQEKKYDWSINLPVIDDNHIMIFNRAYYKLGFINKSR